MAAGLMLAVAAGCTTSVETGTSGSGGGTGTGTGTGGGLCAGFVDQKATSSVTVRFHNQTGVAMFLPAQCGSVDYQITPVAGADGVTYVYDGSCLETCHALQTMPQIYCGACQQTTYRLEAGATREVTWEGAGLKSVTMPTSCWASASNGQEQCDEIVAAPAAAYRIDVTGFSACMGDCTCDASGLCVGSPTGQQASPGPMTFNFPAAGSVDVTFPTCAFGCP